MGSDGYRNLRENYFQEVERRKLQLSEARVLQKERLADQFSLTGAELKTFVAGG